MSKKFLIASLVISLIILISGCTSDTGKTNSNNNDATQQDVKIAYVAMTTASPQPLINLSEEIFAEQLAPKTVELIPTRGLENLFPLLDHTTDDPDFVYLPFNAFTTYITKTSRFGGSDKYTVIAGSMNLDDIQLVVRPGINSLEELDGKKVGIPNLRYTDDYQLNQLLAPVGLRTSSLGGTVEIVWDDIVIALLDSYEEGKYDAIVLFNTDNVGQALNRVPGSKTYLINPTPEKKYPRTWLAAKRELIDSNPELVKTMLTAHIISTESALENIDRLPELNRDAFVGWFSDLGADVSAKNPLEKFVERWEKVDITYDPDTEFISSLYQYLSENNLVDGVSMEDFVQTDLLNEVLAEMGKSPVK